MIRVTPDTNVLVSAFFFNGNERELLRKAIEGRIRFALSNEMLDEIITVLDEKFHVETNAIMNYVLRLSEVTEIVKPRRIRSVKVRDRGDAKVIECANTGMSVYIVTGDKDLLSIRRYRRTKIVTARQFLKSSAMFAD